MIKAIIFDRDGIIANTEGIHVLSVTKAFQELGINIDEDTKKHIVGKHTDKYKDYLHKKYSFTYDKFRKRQKEIFYELFENVEFFNDTINLIKQLKEHGYLIALTTSAGHSGTNIILEKTKLTETFDVVVTKEDYVEGKPNPEPYLLTAKKLGVNPKDCLVIEDSDVGTQSAKNAGMKCIAIPNEYTKDHDLSRADLIITDRSKIKLSTINTFTQSK